MAQPFNYELHCGVHSERMNSFSIYYNKKNIKVGLDLKFIDFK